MPKLSLYSTMSIYKFVRDMISLREIVSVLPFYYHTKPLIDKITSLYGLIVKRNIEGDLDKLREALLGIVYT